MHDIRQMKLKICMVVNIPYKAGAVEIGPANRKGMIKYLVKFGHSVTWVAPAEDTNRLQQFKKDGVSVFAMPHFYRLNDSSLIGKILNRGLNAPKRARAILDIVRQGEYNVLYVKGDILDGIIGVYIERKYRIPFVFDSEPLGMVWEVYKIKSKSPTFLLYPIAKFHDIITLYIMKKADLITPSSKWFAEELAQRGVPERKLMPFPNAVDINAFSNRDSNVTRQKYQLGKSQVIVYIGTLDKARNLAVLIEAYRKVRSHSNKVKLLMVGEGSGKEKLQEYVRELEMEEEVIFTGQVPGLQVPDFIAAADIGVSAIAPLACYKIGSPLKVLEYMGGGKPVVANEEILDQKEVVEQSGGGILVPFNSEAFADAIIELLNNPERAAAMGKRGRQWVNDNRSYEVLARQIENRLTELVLTERGQH